VASVLKAYISGTVDPSVTPTYGEFGWVYSQLGITGIKIFQKQDNGVTSNWLPLSSLGPNINLAPYGECLDENDAVQAAIDAKKVQAAAATEATGITANLQALINAAANGDVIQINSNGPYGAITFPAAVGITLRAGTGFIPVFTAVNAITIPNGGLNLFFIGLKFLNCTSVDGNGLGSAICLEHLGIFTNVYVSNCTLEKCSNSGILLAYHQTLGGDNYANAYSAAELSTGFWVVDGTLLRAASDITEGAAILCRGVQASGVRRTQVDAGDGTDPWPGEGVVRGVMFQSSRNISISNVLVKNGNNPAGNGEGFKMDNLATPTDFACTVTVEKSYSTKNRKGFVCDDDFTANFRNCVATSNVLSGFDFRKATSAGTLYRSTGMGNGTGTFLEAVVPVGAVSLDCNLMLRNTAQYNLANGYVLPIDNIQGARGAWLDYLSDLPFSFPAGVARAIPYYNAGGTSIESEAALKYDPTNNLVGIDQATPLARIHANSTTTAGVVGVDAMIFGRVHATNGIGAGSVITGGQGGLNSSTGVDNIIAGALNLSDAGRSLIVGSTNNAAVGNNHIVGGFTNSILGGGSDNIVAGQNNILTSAADCLVVGDTNTITSRSRTVIAGISNAGNANNSVVVGNGNTVSGDNSIVGGNVVSATHTNSLAVGDNLASNRTSGTVVGSWNPADADAQFQVGIGTGAGDKRSALSAGNSGLIKMTEGGLRVKNTVYAVNSAISATADKNVLLNATGLTMTMPAGVEGQELYIKDITGNANPNATINRAGADTFEGGGTSFTINVAYRCIKFLFHSGVWYQMAIA